MEATPALALRGGLFLKPRIRAFLKPRANPQKFVPETTCEFTAEGKFSTIEGVFDTWFQERLDLPYFMPPLGFVDAKMSLICAIDPLAPRA